MLKTLKKYESPTAEIIHLSEENILSSSVETSGGRLLEEDFSSNNVSWSWAGDEDEDI